MAALPVETPDLKMLTRFGCGAVLLRGAGCTVNDLIDHDIDVKVQIMWYVDLEPLRSRKKEDDIESKGDELATEVDGFLQVEKVDFDFTESNIEEEVGVTEFNVKVSKNDDDQNVHGAF